MSKARRSNDISGKGAEMTGARWNQKSIPALYLAENRSLAIIETIVHCLSIKDLYNRFVLSIEVPDRMIDVFDKKNLPKNWNSTPWNNYTIEQGTKWLNSFRNLILQVPSAIVPEENNFIVNPRHPEFNKNVKLKIKEHFKPDHRLVLQPKAK